MMSMRLDLKAVQAELNKAGEPLVDELANDAYQYFVAQTPIKSGNARRSTELDKTNSKTVIVGDYPYAQRLDDGYSRQSPSGMSKPTERYLEKRINTIVGKIK